jgi:hypothetical protein
VRIPPDALERIRRERLGLPPLTKKQEFIRWLIRAAILLSPFWILFIYQCVTGFKPL